MTEQDRGPQLEDRRRTRRIAAVVRKSPLFEELLFGEALNTHLKTLEASGVPTEDVERFYFLGGTSFLDSSSTKRVAMTERLGRINNGRKQDLTNGNGNHHNTNGINLTHDTEHLI